MCKEIQGLRKQEASVLSHPVSLPALPLMKDHQVQIQSSHKKWKHFEKEKKGQLHAPCLVILRKAMMHFSEVESRGSATVRPMIYKVSRD